jgi:signal transduction histidine kinase
MIRWTSGMRARDPRGWQLIALLLVAVVVPASAVLWFMNEAATNQAVASRRAVTDAYRGQLRLVRGRLNDLWRPRVADLESGLTADAAADFKRLVTSGAADSFVVIGKGGRPLYPSIDVARPSISDPELPDPLEARAFQQQVRDLLRSGNKPAAADLILRRFPSAAALLALDANGRSIAADQLLLLVNLLQPTDARRAATIERLITLVNDYSSRTLSAAQRLFLMDELSAAGLAKSGRAFPTLAAERMAILFLERDRLSLGDVALRPGSTGDIWHVTGPEGRLVALYTTAAILKVVQPLLDEQSTTDVRFVAFKPDAPGDDEAVAIGSAMPGWQISFAIEIASGSAAQSRRRSYLAIAVLAIAAIGVAVATLGGAARRQARLAALKTDLVSAVSHELKTPIASMRLLVDTLLDEEGRGGRELDPVKTREYLNLMAVENARLSRLIDNFLTFSRLERNRQRFRLEPTNATDVVRDALAALPEERRGERVPTVELAPDLPAVMADRDALVTALLNLLDNAYKYGPPDQRVIVRVFAEAGDVVFAVEDQGIGIPARERKKIFRRFYRVDQRLARETSGTGLGLSIVEAIIRAHSGRVGVSSRPGQGSTFSLRVPRAAEGAPV